MLAYSEKLTLTPWEVEPGDVEALRRAGFDDTAIGDIAAHVAMFALFNRIVDGLGGKLRPEMVEEARRLGYPLHEGTY